MKTDERWRVIHGFPFFVALLQGFLFMFFIRQEPVVFNIANGNNEEAAALLKKVYQQGDLNETALNEKVLVCVN